MDDIIKDLNIRVLSNTRSELGIYDEETGTFKVGDFANRFILAETDKRIVESGDENVETLTPAVIHKKKKNPDLWIRFLKIYRKHKVRLVWIKGHNNDPENEMCDRLAVDASLRAVLLEDKGYTPEEESNMLL